MRKQPFLPTREKHRLELQPLGAVQRHDRHAPRAGGFVRLHHQRHMLQKSGEIRKLLHRAHEFLEVFEPPGRFRRFVLPPHLGIAGLVEHELREFVMRLGVDQHPPALEIAEQRAQGRARLRPDLLALDEDSRGLHQRDVFAPREFVQHLQRGVAEAALWRVDDALEGEIVGGLRDAAQIGEGVADFGALIEARAADDAIGQAERDEAFLEFAHLERGAHENGDLFEIVRAPLQLLDRLADRPRFLLAVPDAGHARLFALVAVGEQRLAEPAFVVGDQMRGGGENMAGGAIIALEPHGFRAGKILFEAQDVFDLGAAPTIDALVVVANAADVAPPLRDQPQPQILRGVGVLIFVDQNIFETPLIIGEHVGVVAKQP